MTTDTRKTKQSPPRVPSTPPAPASGQYEDVELPAADLVLMPGKQHPVADEDVAALAESIAIVGQLHRVHARRALDGPHEILSGRKRHMACARLDRAVQVRLWSVCSDELADQIRFMENEKRSDPSAYDHAVSLRLLKNRHGWTAEEVGRHVAISATTAKSYLSIFNASDRLLEAIQSRALPIKLACLLVRYERRVGERGARALIAKAAAGDVSAADVERHIAAKRGDARKKKTSSDPWSQFGKRAAKLLAKDPAAREGALKLHARLTELLGEAS